ncbi:MAG: glycosyltransferase [Candidatus Dormibacteria bacterium]
MRTLIAGGGTGGHLTPALAVAEALRDADPSGAVLMVSRRGGVGEELIREAGVALETLDISGLDTSQPLTLLTAAARLPLATLRALRLLRSFGADVVVGTAGYVCVPVVLAAGLLRVPVVLLEQNAHPGRAIRLLAPRARVVAASFAGTAALLRKVRVVHTGNPLRAGLLATPLEPLPEAPARLLLTGGSQGALRLNRALAGCVRRLLERHPTLRITHQCGTTGAADALAAAAALPETLRARYEVAPFFLDLGARMRAADLVVMRAGGSSLAECSTIGRPMILVPYAHAGGHQAYNAMPYVRGGAAVMVLDEECSAVRLRNEVGTLLADVERWRGMARASAAMGHPEAAERVVGLIREVVRS